MFAIALVRIAVADIATKDCDCHVASEFAYRFGMDQSQTTALVLGMPAGIRCAFDRLTTRAICIGDLVVSSRGPEAKNVSQVHG